MKIININPHIFKGLKLLAKDHFSDFNQYLINYNFIYNNHWFHTKKKVTQEAPLPSTFNLHFPVITAGIFRQSVSEVAKASNFGNNQLRKEIRSFGKNKYYATYHSACYKRYYYK